MNQLSHVGPEPLECGNVLMLSQVLLEVLEPFSDRIELHLVANDSLTQRRVGGA